RSRSTFHVDKHLVLFVSEQFATGNARDHDHHGFTVEEHLLYEVPETIGFGIVLELEAHVFHQLRYPKTSKRQAVSKVRLAIDNEVIALRKLFCGWCFFP